MIKTIKKQPVRGKDVLAYIPVSQSVIEGRQSRNSEPGLVLDTKAGIYLKLFKKKKTIGHSEAK